MGSACSSEVVLILRIKDVETRRRLRFSQIHAVPWLILAGLVFQSEAWSKS